MKKPVKIFLASLTAVILCAALGYMLFAPAVVQAYSLTQGVLTQDFTETGKLVSVRDVLLSSGIGEVTVGSIAVQEGQRVKEGELLLTLEPGSLGSLLQNRMEQQQQRRKALQAQRTMTQAERTIAIEQARVSFESAKWEYELLFNEEWGIGDNLLETSAEDMLQARYTWQEVRDGDDVGMAANRAHSLYRQSVDGMIINRAKYSDEAKAYYSALAASSEKALKALENNYASVESIDAALGELDAAIALLQSQLETTEICAPFAGVVHSIAVGRGQALQATVPLLSLAEEQALEAEVHLLAADAIDVKVGDSVLCKLENGVDFAGTVGFVAAAAQERISTVGLIENRCLVKIMPQNLPQGAGAGFGVDAKFSVVRAQNVFAVPLSAVVTGDGEKAVYRLQGSKAVYTPVTTGITASGYVEITQGLAEGEQIILLPQEAGVRNGTRVKVE